MLRNFTTRVAWMLLLSACGGRGKSVPEPNMDAPPCEVQRSFDVTESRAFFPYREGNRWAYRGMAGADDPFGNYRTDSTLTGPKQIGPITAETLLSTFPAGSSTPVERYLMLDDGGVTNHGNDDPNDRITPDVVSYREVQFPLQICSSFEPHPLHSRTFDVDGDGVTDSITTKSRITVRALERVETPLATFDDALRIESKVIERAALSSTATTRSAEVETVQWFVKGVGPVARRFS